MPWSCARCSPLASAGLKDFEAALADIDTAIAAHRTEFDHGADKPCATMMCLRRTRAGILARLGREQEARAAREAAAAAPSAYPVTAYELFHRRLDQLSAHLVR